MFINDLKKLIEQNTLESLSIVTEDELDSLNASFMNDQVVNNSNQTPSAMTYCRDILVICGLYRHNKRQVEQFFDILGYSYEHTHTKTQKHYALTKKQPVLRKRDCIN